MRLKFIIEYDGRYLNGWDGDYQNPNTIFIKRLLEQAFFNLTQENVVFFCSGRTDSGVHAINQVCHCDSLTKLPINRILFGFNHFLPHFLKIKHVSIVDNTFHARFSTKQRVYRYVIFNANYPPVLNNKCWHIKTPLDINLLEQAAQILIGYHDFSSFCPAKYDKLRLRTIDDIQVIVDQETMNLTFIAKSFMHHQVRNMTSALIQVAKKHWTLEKFIYVFHAKDIRLCSSIAPAHGLFLERIIY